jgi:hypothetical protein
VRIIFDKHELTNALAVLRALAQYFNASFIQEAADDLARDLFPPPLLPETKYYHLCEKCFRMMDIRNENHIHYKGEKERYVHQKCTPLKENRPE